MTLNPQEKQLISELSTSAQMVSPGEVADLSALARGDLACYCVALWPGFQLSAHHRVIIDHLEAVEQGKISRLIIQCPPRHGKSMLASQFFPAWYLGRHPERAVITASYGQELADDFGRRVRYLLRDPFHRTIFPGCRLADGATSFRSFAPPPTALITRRGEGGRSPAEVRISSLATTYLRTTLRRIAT
jgi:hypothetical protein